MDKHNEFFPGKEKKSMCVVVHMQAIFMYIMGSEEYGKVAIVFSPKMVVFIDMMMTFMS